MKSRYSITMAKNKFDDFLNKPMMRMVLTLVSATLSTIVLAFSTLTILSVYQQSYEVAPRYLIWIFIFLGLISFVVFLKKRTKINLIRSILMLVFDIVLGIVVLFAKDNPYLFSLTAGLYCISIIISRILHLIQDHKVRNIILNGLIILFALFLGIGLLAPVSGEEQISSIILIECLFIAIVSFIEAASVAFSQLKINVLLKIIVNTYSLEVLFGMLTMIVCFSLVFYVIEPAMPTFPDALWYCFAVVTTIGFGDMVAVTPIGRILTVVLGLYGLIVVAVITSIIVNFYNETSGKRESKELKELKEEVKNDKK